MAYPTNNYVDGHLEWIKENVRYDPETGRLFWTIRARGRNLARPLGCIDRNGYVKLNLNNVSHYGHRVVWALHYGVFPTFEIDHIDGVKRNNRIENLQQASAAENQMNRGAPVNNTTGVKGVSVTPFGRYKVTKQGQHVGNFKTLKEAEDAYIRHN